MPRKSKIKDQEDDCPSINTFVTRSECAAINTDMKADLKVLKFALVGEDLRGGIVKDIAELKKSVFDSNELVKEEKQTNKFKADLSNRWKIAILTLVVTSLTSVIIEITHILH